MFSKVIEYINTNDNIDIEYLNALLPDSFNVKIETRPIQKVTLNSNECLVSTAYDTTRQSMLGLFESISPVRLEMISKFNELRSEGLAEVDNSIAKVFRINKGKVLVNRSFFNMSVKNELYASLLINNAKSLLRYMHNNKVLYIRLQLSKSDITLYGDTYYVKISNDIINIKTGELVSEQELALVESKKRLLDIEI